jgi:hypothetical protein
MRFWKAVGYAITIKQHRAGATHTEGNSKFNQERQRIKKSSTSSKKIRLHTFALTVDLRMFVTRERQPDRERRREGSREREREKRERRERREREERETDRYIYIYIYIYRYRERERGTAPIMFASTCFCITATGASGDTSLSCAVTEL